MKSQKEALFGNSKSFACSSRGQLAAVLVMVLLVAAVGAFVVFSSKQTGKAFSIAGQQPTSSPTQTILTAGQQQRPPVQAYIPPTPAPQYEGPPPGVERKEGTTETTEKPKCSYTCSCSSNIVEYTCVLVDPDKPENRKKVPLSGSYPKDKNGVVGKTGTNIAGEPIFRCTAPSGSMPAPATKTGMTDEECTAKAKQKACDGWAEKNCAETSSVFSGCIDYYFEQCVKKQEERYPASKGTGVEMVPVTKSTGKVGAPTAVAAK